MELREPAQEVEVVPARGANRVEIVATGDRRTDDQQHHLLERIHHPPRLPVHRQAGKNASAERPRAPAGPPRPGSYPSGRTCFALHAESERTRIHNLRVKAKLPKIAR